MVGLNVLASSEQPQQLAEPTVADGARPQGAARLGAPQTRGPESPDQAAPTLSAATAPTLAAAAQNAERGDKNAPQRGSR